MKTLLNEGYIEHNYRVGINLQRQLIFNIL